MLYILFGPDDYSKKLHLQRLIKELGLPVTEFAETESVPEFGSMIGSDLFGGTKIFVLNNALAKVLTDEAITMAKGSSNHIVFLEDSLDKRLKTTKTLLADTAIKTQEFLIPEDQKLVSWITNRASGLGGSLEKAVAIKLLSQLGVEVGESKRFGSEQKVSLWQIDSEIQKLIAYANGAAITYEMINALVPEDISAEGFDIINALADKNTQKVFNLCERFFYESAGGDEKAKFIMLGSLLADQFRSIVIVQGFLAERTPDAEILKDTGWKPGRLFIMKKIVSKFEPKKVLETLSKLESLDIELKTTSTPPHVLMDLILAQAV